LSAKLLDQVMDYAQGRHNLSSQASQISFATIPSQLVLIEKSKRVKTAVRRDRQPHRERNFIYDANNQNIEMFINVE